MSRYPTERGRVLRFNDGERQLKDLQAAHTSLSRQNDCLRKNHEHLQLQHDR